MDKKKSYGQCRCCFSKGNHRNILQEYYHEGVREVYLETFMDCFNLFLSTNNTLSTLICSQCISRLREASSFRQQVAESERKLLELVSNDQDMVFVNVPVEVPPSVVKPEPLALKEEVIDDEVADDDTEVMFDTDFISADELIVPDKNSEHDLIPGEAALLARFLPGSLPPLCSRGSLYRICPQFVHQLDLLAGKKITSSNILKPTQELKRPFRNRNLFISEKLAHITNATTLLQYSNITPFKSKSRSGYPCFFCRHIFEDFKKLKEHVKEHKPSEIQRVLKPYGPESIVVYAEVSNLKCIICNVNIPSINELKTHLTNVHKKKLYTEVSDRVIPFKINDGSCECPTCGCNFETFGALERHMNGHYRNYVCKECGAGFVTKYRLKVHLKSMHVDGTHPCEYCGKIFSTQQKHKNHVNAVHKLIKRFKCVKCPQRFAEYFRRQRHMEELHGFTPLKYKCNVCDRAFDRRYTLSRHLKRDHLEERDYQCEVCAYKCFTKNELKVHMVKHGGERIFECSVCKKSYARKKTLKEHMRIHNNDRRFACAVCGQAFVQKCSLKGHLKTHHLEYSLQQV